MSDLEKKAAAFNARILVGTQVYYFPVRGDFRFCVTKTRSEAWVMAGHSVMVLLDGVSGGVLVDHVKTESEVAA